MNSLDRLKNIMPPEMDRDLLLNLFDALADLLEDTSRTESERKKLVLDLTRYLERKRPSQMSDGVNELEYLKYVRNSLAHRKQIPEEGIRVAMPMFWKFLREIATTTNWDKISNLLAYSLRQKDVTSQSEKVSIKSKIRKYELIFNNLPDSEKLMVFESALLNLYSTEEFQNYLKKRRTIEI